MAEQNEKLVTLTIDNREVTVPAGTLIVDAAASVDIEIPVFCSHPKLDPVACCRMCLVEVIGQRGPQMMTACSVPVSDGMVVNTGTDAVKATQEANLTFLLLNHPLDCPICDKGGECPLQDQTMRFGPGISELVEPKRRKKKNYDISDTIVLDQERCVICWRCIRYLQEWEDKPQLALFERGGETLIDIQPGKPVDAKTSGNIIDICPVGALTNREARFSYRPWEITRTPSICTQCSVGCNLRLDTRTHRLRRIVGRENPQVNDQWLCDKGRFAHAWVNDQERLTMPLLRKDGALTPVPWHEALQFVVDRLKNTCKKQGPSAIGGIGSGKLSNESNYALQRFMRQVIGTNNIDHRDGGEVAALPGGLPALADIMKPQYGPNPKVDCVLLFGIDPSEELPIVDLHLKRAINRGGVKLVIAHPRKVELTRYGGPYLGYRPGAEVALLDALTHAALSASEGANSDTGDYVPGKLETLLDTCRVDGEELQRAAKLLAESERTLIVYGPQAARGEAGVEVRKGLTNLAIATGNIERLAYVGLEANSQGCRDMGVLPDRLPGHAALNDEDARKRLEELWGVEPPTAVGLTYSQMLDSAGNEIKAMFIMGADPASERSAWARNLADLDLLVVQDLYLTQTAALADVVLPAVSWVESDGTFTNLERRVQRAPRALVNEQSKAAPDWLIFDHMASRMGIDWPFADVEGITFEIARAVPQYEGLTWDALSDQGVQWDAEAVRSDVAYQAIVQPDLPAEDGQFNLVTGTVLYDDGNLFSRTELMRDMAFGPGAGINPEDAQRLGVVDGTPLRLINAADGDAEGHAESLSLPAIVSEQVLPGTVWVPASQRNAPVGDLLDGARTTSVVVEVAAAVQPAATTGAQARTDD
ncbi:MAG: NADH-quinone oxidoreductase subunit NuoG [Caldilineaceae bacterium]